MSDLLTPDQLGERWGKTRQALAQMRYRGDGPRFVKIGKSVLYRVQDVLDFEESQIRTRTDDEPAVA
ncbi:helix-turn-helix transcriptional regulator [Corynebacterium gallinarum]|uniref:DNA-binding protein n=1 Tax=Corynebacterium gallinarum TaxID=2762214 RepID=A0A8I0LF49_9CORY|nr:DNA-binding protein [Corynebacterium gallinarum]MBD8029209.1 DNA-binding protein [Corynebacterium gallinarum]